MSSYCPNKFVSLSFVLSLSSFVRGQTFLKARDGTKLSLGVPETLSEKCQLVQFDKYGLSTKPTNKSQGLRSMKQSSVTHVWGV